MNFDVTITPTEAIREIGSRLMALRLGRNMTRAELARRSGVAERTLARLEGGEGRVRLEAFVAVCSTLAILGRFDVLLPSVRQSPEEVYKRENPRRRARAKKKTAIVWGDEK